MIIIIYKTILLCMDLSKLYEHDKGNIYQKG